MDLGAIAETVSVTAQLGAGLLPGVVMTGDDPESFSGGANYRVLGSRDRANSISVDGTPVTDTDSGGGKRLSVSQDAVAEVKPVFSPEITDGVPLLLAQPTRDRNQQESKRVEGPAHGRRIAARARARSSASRTI